MAAPATTSGVAAATAAAIAADAYYSGYYAPGVVVYGGTSGTAYASDAAMMQTTQMQGENWTIYAVALGLGADYDFMDRMARMGSTADVTRSSTPAAAPISRPISTASAQSAGRPGPVAGPARPKTPVETIDPHRNRSSHRLIEES